MKYTKGKNASDKLSISIEGFPLLLYRITAWFISKKFSLTKIGTQINSLEVKSIEYERGGAKLAIEWDVWEGIVISARSGNATSLVEEIGLYLKSKLRL